MRPMLSFAAFLMLVACAGTMPGEQIHDDYAQPLERELFTQKANCIREWGGVYDEWRSGGGGLTAPLESVRAQIRRDDKSRFARMVRAVWAFQKVPRDYPHIGNWPLRKGELTAVLAAIPAGFLSEYVSSDCDAFSYMGPILWKRVNDPTAGRDAVNPPGDLEWEPTMVENWLLYWILMRSE